MGPSTSENGLEEQGVIVSREGLGSVVCGGERWSFPALTMEAPMTGFSLSYILAVGCVVGAGAIRAPYLLSSLSYSSLR